MRAGTAIITAAGLLIAAAATGCNKDSPADAGHRSECTLLRLDHAWAAAHDSFEARQDGAKSCTLHQGGTQIGLAQASDATATPLETEMLTSQGFTLERVGAATLASSRDGEGGWVVLLPGGRTVMLELTLTGAAGTDLSRALVPMFVP